MPTKNDVLTIILPNGRRQQTNIDPRDSDPRDQWTNRFPVNSSSSDVIHTVAQHKKLRHWGCSCNGWKRWRHCQHLESNGLPCGPKGSPNYLKPYEIRLVKN
jgi:hypothetical protein